MYSVGDVVVYSIHGVCRIEAVEERKVDKNTASYFVLRPLENEKIVYFIPVHNQAALLKLRPLTDRQTLEAVFQTPEVLTECWIPEENQRKLRYKELISSLDFAATVQMVHTLHCHRTKQLSSGKKVHQCDENFLRDAKRMLDSELSVILEIPVSQVESYIVEHYL